VIVLDASVWISSLITSDVHHRVTRDWLVTITGESELLAVPSIFLAEVCGAVTRRTGVRTAGMAALQHILSSTAIQIFSMDLSFGGQAARLASELSLRGADAMYVALAVQTGSPLVSWDFELLARAESVIPVRRPR
jgi:predicted nucleic acid-binding protein